MAAFESAVDGVEDMVEAHRMMGQPDYLLRVVTENRQTYETLYIEVLAALPTRKAHVTAGDEDGEAASRAADSSLIRHWAATVARTRSGGPWTMPCGVFSQWSG
jgi:putative heme iron utilization protein